MITTLLLLGATGDLARRYLYPALADLLARGLLPEGLRVVGAASERPSDEWAEALPTALPPDLASYRPVDLSDPASLADAIGATTDPVAVYLALPPATFPTAIRSLAELDLPAGSRIVLEKPFGDDEESAAALNELLATLELDVYRVDHALAMATTNRMLALRRANPVLEQLWNAPHVEQVEVLWEETIALEGRAGYFDQAGMLKDVLQNHMLQLLAVTAMAADGDDADDQSAGRLAVLRSAHTEPGARRARYTAGTLADGRPVPAYADEDGVDPDRDTETFVEVTIRLDDPRWDGTPFVLRAGKALGHDRKLVRLTFRGGSALEIGIDDPYDISLSWPTGSGEPVTLREAGGRDDLPAYAHVLLDVLGGTHAHAVSGAEAVEAWRVVAPVLAEWRAGATPLQEYPAGAEPPTT